MRYVIGDIHGCYEQYMELLRAIDLQDEDELYVLGDAMDRGPEPVKVLQDIMKRQNAHYILGNHDFIMYSVMKKLMVEITDENVDSHLTVEDILDYRLWMQDGGESTAEQFRALGKDERWDILDYLADAPLYEVLEHDGKKYILVHGGLGNFSPDKELEDYELHELLEERMDYTKRYYPDKKVHLVTGHTPTVYIEGWNKMEVYIGNGHIALDCACVSGGKLAAFCIETEEVFYVNGR